MSQSLKEFLKDSIDNLPDQPTKDEITNHVHVVELIYRRLRQSSNGKTISHEDALKIISGERKLEH